jgi:predicted secreted hydrolase
VPSANIDLQVRTRLDSQELVGTTGTTPVYWEGAVEITGTHSGRGYLEMTGYAGEVKMGE